MSYREPQLPNPAMLREARDRFRDLLAMDTREADWQRFFAAHPYVLSMTLPVRFEPTDLIPLGRAGKTEPDFVFYPQPRRPVPFYGVIELKRPTTKLLTVPRANVASLARDTQTAVRQAISYSEAPQSFLPPDVLRSTLFLGNRAHLFVIAGMSTELAAKLVNEILRESLERWLPPNLQLIPYDTLLGMFEAQVPPKLHLLFPKIRRQGPIRLRAAPRYPFEYSDLDSMLGSLEFYDRHRNSSGGGIAHDYQEIDVHRDRFVVDHATGLMWQQGGSDSHNDSASAANYAEELTEGGFRDWRVPTLEEAMSLVKPIDGPDDCCLDSRFGNRPSKIVTSDVFDGPVYSRKSGWWVVHLNEGYADTAHGDYDGPSGAGYAGVKAVRTLAERR